MSPSQIREYMQVIDNHPDQIRIIRVKMLIEVAAQLSEINEKIIRPTDVVVVEDDEDLEP